MKVAALIRFVIWRKSFRVEGGGFVVVRTTFIQTVGTEKMEAE